MISYDLSNFHFKNRNNSSFINIIFHILCLALTQANVNIYNASHRVSNLQFDSSPDFPSKTNQLEEKNTSWC